MTASPLDPLHGTDPHGVIAAIRERHRRRLQGDSSPDGRKLALVIEGGALRGVSSAGGAVALAQLGFSSVFDEVYATSAAVMNAAYFISNQPLLGISVYFDSCTTRRFVNPLRFWKIIDVDYIFDHVAVHEKPLDTGRVLASPTTLFVAVMDRRNGEAWMVNTKRVDAPLLTALKASAAIPVFYNRTVELEGRPCMDGGLVIPFGLRHALDNGCTDVLVLSTRPADYISTPAGAFDRFVFNTLCARGNAALRSRFAERHLPSNASRDLACGRLPAPPGARIATVCAEDHENIPMMTSDRESLRRAASSYARKTLRLFGVDADTWSLPENCGQAEQTLPRPLDTETA